MKSVCCSHRFLSSSQRAEPRSSINIFPLNSFSTSLPSRVSQDASNNFNLLEFISISSKHTVSEPSPSKRARMESTNPLTLLYTPQLPAPLKNRSFLHVMDSKRLIFIYSSIYVLIESDGRQVSAKQVAIQTEVDFVHTDQPLCSTCALFDHKFILN